MMESNSKSGVNCGLDRIETDFFEALQRLKSGEPTVPRLLGLLKKGLLRISFSTVSEEARHSRTLISLLDCSYPNVREAVLVEMSRDNECKIGKGHKPASAQKVISDLRARLKMEQNEKQILATRLVEAENIVRHYQKLLTRKDETYSRSKRSDDRLSKNSTSRSDY